LGVNEPRRKSSNEGHNARAYNCYIQYSEVSVHVYSNSL